jgi:hypothetical protein
VNRLHLECDDAELTALVHEWFAAGRIEPPADVSVTLRLSDEPWRGQDSRPVLTQPGLVFHHGAPEHTVRVVWRQGEGHAVIPPSPSMRAAIELTRQAAAEPDRWLRPFLLPVLLVLLRRAGWHHIHAATARDSLGRGWLFAGNARAGKSTTAAVLAARGWAVGTDDTGFLVAGAKRVEATCWRAPIALRDGGRALLARAGLDDTGSVTLTRRAKAGFFPEDLGGSWLERVPLDVVALTTVHDGPTRITPLSRAAALAELLSWSLLFVVDHADAQAHLDLMARLTREARCVRLELGRDLVEGPVLLEALVS